MTQNSPKMAQDGWNAVNNGLKWHKVGQNGSKWLKVVQNGPKWHKIGPKWLKIGPKWLKMIENGSQWAAKACGAVKMGVSELFGAILSHFDLFWPILCHFNPLLTVFQPSWPILGLLWVIFSKFWPILTLFWAILRTLGSKLVEMAPTGRTQNRWTHKSADAWEWLRRAPG